MRNRVTTINLPDVGTIQELSERITHPVFSLRLNSPLLLEGIKRNYFINKPPLVFPSLRRRGRAGSPLEGSPPKEGGVLPSVSVRNWDDRKITPPVFIPMCRDSATSLKVGVRGIGTPRQSRRLTGNYTIEYKSIINQERHGDFGVIVA